MHIFVKLLCRVKSPVLSCLTSEYAILPDYCCHIPTQCHTLFSHALLSVIKSFYYNPSFCTLKSSIIAYQIIFWHGANYGVFLKCWYRIMWSRCWINRPSRNFIMLKLTLSVLSIIRMEIVYLFMRNKLFTNKTCQQSTQVPVESGLNVTWWLVAWYWSQRTQSFHQIWLSATCSGCNLEIEKETKINMDIKVHCFLKLIIK